MVIIILGSENWRSSEIFSRGQAESRSAGESLSWGLAQATEFRSLGRRHQVSRELLQIESESRMVEIGDIGDMGGRVVPCVGYEG